MNFEQFKIAENEVKNRIPTEIGRIISLYANGRENELARLICVSTATINSWTRTPARKTSPAEPRISLLTRLILGVPNIKLEDVLRLVVPPEYHDQILTWANNTKMSGKNELNAKISELEKQVRELEEKISLKDRIIELLEENKKTNT